MDWKTNLRNRNIGAEEYGFGSILSKSYNVVNTDRSVGGRISGAIATKYGDSAAVGGGNAGSK
jgi:hypothetical protein